jgi:hypothetical protein
MGGDRWLREKYRFTFRVSRSNTDRRGGRTEDRILCRDPASTNASHFPKTGVTRKDRHALIPGAVPIILVLLHGCKCVH